MFLQRSYVDSEITGALAQLGVSPTADMPMVVQIKKEVRVLCSGSVVRQQIMKNDAEQARRDASNRMISKPVNAFLFFVSI